MKLKSIILGVAFYLCLSVVVSQGASGIDELAAFVEKVQAKLKTGPQKEANMADELKEFDALVAKYKHTEPETAAQALFLKAILYGQIFEDSKKAADLMEQIQKDFPNTAPAKRAVEVMANIKKNSELKKIEAGLLPGTKFPDFTEKDIEGKPLSLANYKGKVVLVDFWATWCKICVEELPNVKKTYGKYHKAGFEIVGINLDDERDKMMEFLKKNEIKWVQYSDGQGWDGKLPQTYGIVALPATYLLDGEGKIIAKGLQGDDLEAAVAKALKK